MLYQLSYAHHRFIMLYHCPNADDVSLMLIPANFRLFEVSASLRTKTSQWSY